jgi:hypothetical protein
MSLLTDLALQQSKVTMLKLLTRMMDARNHPLPGADPFARVGRRQ